MIFTIIKYFGIFIIIAAVGMFALDAYFKAPAWKGPVTDHFDGKKFFNIAEPGAVAEDQSPFEVIKWMLSRDANEWVDRDVVTVKPAERVMGSEIVATFINHAAVLIQTEGLNIITDPIYSKRASPVGFTGPRRYVDPGIRWEDLPVIDIVLISYNHYDHMDIGTLKKLKETSNPVVLVPLGNKKFLAKKGVDSIELDWWSTYALADNISITLVPSQHFSARAVTDRNNALWGGYVVSSPAGDIYFAGDTGYGPFVKKIKENYPKGFRLGFLPIGAFKPEWFMGKVHVGPAESVKMAEELSIKKVMAIHFGTFKLADDAQDEPTETLRVVQNSAVVSSASSFVTVPNGGVVEIK